MIYYKPITDRERLIKLFPDENITENQLCGGYVGFYEDGSEAGRCFVKIEGYNCFLSSLYCDFSDKLLTEGFIRAALNFCANRSAYMAFCSQENIADVLVTLGFEKDENNIYSGDIPTLLKGSCCK